MTKSLENEFDEALSGIDRTVKTLVTQRDAAIAEAETMRKERDEARASARRARDLHDGDMCEARIMQTKARAEAAEKERDEALAQTNDAVTHARSVATDYDALRYFVDGLRDRDGAFWIGPRTRRFEQPPSSQTAAKLVAEFKGEWHARIEAAESSLSALRTENATLRARETELAAQVAALRGALEALVEATRNSAGTSVTIETAHCTAQAALSSTPADCAEAVRLAAVALEAIDADGYGTAIGDLEKVKAALAALRKCGMVLEPSNELDESPYLK